MPVEFITADGLPAPRLPRRRLRRWISCVAEGYGCTIGDLCYRFCPDDEILSCNRQFLSHDYYTDVITFDESDGKILNGAILISLDTVRSNARVFGKTYYNELLRVIIHAVLHLCGLGDKSEEEAAAMRRAEDNALALWRNAANE